MYRFMLALLAVSTMFGVSVGTGHASSSLRDALAERFGLSRIEVQNASGEGRVIEKGTVLELRADRIPANKLRFVQINTKSPRFHVADYARVAVGTDGRLTADPGALSLTKGARLVVLDLKVDQDQVLFTHTLDPLRLADGTSAYGCTEFVFRFDLTTLDRADLTTVAGRIAEWLSVSSPS